MKISLIASIVTGLSFLKPMVAHMVFCGIQEVSMNNVRNVARVQWDIELESVHTHYNGKFPRNIRLDPKYGEGPFRGYPVNTHFAIYEGPASFIFLVVSNKDLSVLKLYYTFAGGYEECPLE
ncbi:BgTH12-02616 [Blumeria graminis f. sp. triticale]|uniref:BgTH12-02616 n=1 Tax=Blumeria graminis f. sp. triticale TaxID=1689686 RepID=A0A9W4GEW0_BLUGR|nr:BgTH12-02616 [Blumeria graminis f. sp. triticale]